MKILTSLYRKSPVYNYNTLNNIKIQFELYQYKNLSPPGIVSMLNHSQILTAVFQELEKQCAEIEYFEIAYFILKDCLSISTLPQDAIIAALQMLNHSPTVESFLLSDGLLPSRLISSTQRRLGIFQTKESEHYADIIKFIFLTFNELPPTDVSELAILYSHLDCVDCSQVSGGHFKSLQILHAELLKCSQELPD